MKEWGLKNRKKFFGIREENKFKNTLYSNKINSLFVNKSPYKNNIQLSHRYTLSSNYLYSQTIPVNTNNLYSYKTKKLSHKLNIQNKNKQKEIFSELRNSIKINEKKKSNWNIDLDFLKERTNKKLEKYHSNIDNNDSKDTINLNSKFVENEINCNDISSFLSPRSINDIEALKEYIVDKKSKNYNINDSKKDNSKLQFYIKFKSVLESIKNN